MTIISRMLVIAAVIFWLPTAAKAELKVVASFSILGDMVSEVAGKQATVTTIVGPNADAHLYSPNVEDALAVSEADVIFVNGLGFETWSQTLIETAGTKAPVFVVTDGVTPLMVEGEVDPHAWNSLVNGMIYVDNIVKGLSQADPKNAATYTVRGDTYKKRLAALHEKSLEKIGSLPEDNRTVITAHDAFGYLADAYGMTFLAPVGIDTEAEPSAQELAALIDQIKKQKVAALFVENITSPALVKQISAETGLEIGGRLFSDALSAKGGPATTYFSMFDHNMTVIYESLSKNQAARG